MAKKPTNGNDNIVLGKRGQVIDALGGDDTVLGGVGADTIYGGEGNDRLSGGSGSDSLFGDAGHDLLSGGPGSNIIQGGNGNDTLLYDWYGTSQPVYINLALGYAVDQVGLNGEPPGAGSGQTFSDAISGVENVSGAPQTTNWIIGDINANYLSGGYLNDVIEGGAGADTLSGGFGDDTYYFSAGDSLAIFNGLDIPLPEDWQDYADNGLVDFVSDYGEFYGYDFGEDQIAFFASSSVEFTTQYDPDLNQTFILYSIDDGGWSGILVWGHVESAIAIINGSAELVPFG